MIHVALFAKPPLPGRTKSRLATGIGAAAAATFARAALLDNLEVIIGANVRASVWYPPEADAADFGELIPEVLPLREQDGADLGERMAHAMDAMLAEGADAAFIIGADCVTHTSASLGAATEIAVTGSLVLQPARDGGFVLIGTDKPSGGMLHDLRWGGADALEQVVARCSETGRQYTLMKETFDVDVADDVALAREWVAENRPDGAVAHWFNEFDA